MSENETVCEIEVIRDGEAGRRGTCWHKVILDFLALQGLKFCMLF